MEETYKTKKAEITFKQDKVIINDNARKEHLTRILSSAMWTIYGIFSLLRYMKTGDDFLLWSGFIIGIGHFVILIFNLFITTKNEIEKNDIVNMELKNRFGNKMLAIKLTNHKTRRIHQVDEIYNDLELYISKNFGQSKI